MNPSDNNTLEDIEKHLEEWNVVYADYRPFKKERCDDVLMEDAEPDVIRLIAKVKEQDREIERLTFQVKGLSVERTSAKQRAEKVENLLAEKEKV